MISITNSGNYRHSRKKPANVASKKINMKKILIPCDFSQPAKDACIVAIDLAIKAKADIVLLYALPIPSLYTTEFMGDPLIFSPTYFSKMEQDINKEFDDLQNRASAKGIKVSTEIAYSSLIAAVQQQIDTRDIDLIVMGTSGSSGFSEIFIGSNTEKVVRFSSVPVLAVRQSFNIEDVKNILVPSTLELNQTEFIDKLKELQEFFHATLNILLVNTPTDFMRDSEANEALNEFVKHYKLTNYKLQFKNNFQEEDGIIEFAYSERMDMIAMATHARKGLAHLFNSSVSENVVNHIKSPVWTYCLKS